MTSFKKLEKKCPGLTSQGSKTMYQFTNTFFLHNNKAFFFLVILNK